MTAAYKKIEDAFGIEDLVSGVVETTVNPDGSSNANS